MCQRASHRVVFSHLSISVPSPAVYLLYLECFPLHPSPSALTVLAFLNDRVSLWKDREPSGFKYESGGDKGGEETAAKNCSASRELGEEEGVEGKEGLIQGEKINSSPRSERLYKQRRKACDTG